MGRIETKPELSNQYENAVQLLKFIQVDYRRARKQLQDVSLRFSEREAIASKQLHTALDALDLISASRNNEVSVSPGKVFPKQVLRQKSAVPPLAARPSVPTLEVYCLGSFQIRVNWEKVEYWRSAKAKSLLKYLIGQGRPVSKDILMEALWPGCEPSLANNNLKATVRALRQTLSLATDTDDNFTWVLFQDGNYMINLEADLWVDIEQFEYHWHAGRQLEKEGKLADAIKEHEAAEALYKGDYLADDLYEEWTSMRREALKDIYLAILGKLADYSMREADYEGCIVCCQKILTKDSCREDAYRRLMCCHSRLGQRNRAIVWYRLCERTIKSELDISPDSQTVALYQKLLNDEYI